MYFGFFAMLRMIIFLPGAGRSPEATRMEMPRMPKGEMSARKVVGLLFSGPREWVRRGGAENESPDKIVKMEEGGLIN